MRRLLPLVVLALLVLAAPAEASIWWISRDGPVGKAESNGSGVDRSFIDSGSFGAGVATNGTHVFWSDGTSVGRNR